MGSQLTEQYRRATGGMTEVLRFGAMMMALQKLIDSTRGVDRSTNPRGAKYASDTGLKAWLKEHAPTIKEATAYRFLHVAEAVMEEFKLPKKVSFIELATTPTDLLPQKLQLKQGQLWDFVNGTSQRSWLDRFAPQKSRGGDTSDFRKNLTPERKHELAVMLLNDTFQGLLLAADAFIERKAYQIQDEADLERSINILENALDAATAWRALPKKERLATAISDLK